jgi:O-methyltransferase involved in polyketide biosynthesis
MLSIVGAGGDSLLTERELDLTDWGFAYGVAWARARERDPSLPEDEIAREALRTAEAVFREYTAGTAEWNGEAGAANGRSQN